MSISDSDFGTDDTQPIDIGEFNDFVDAMVERDALKHRVEALEATLGDMVLDAEQIKRLLLLGLVSVNDIQKFIDRIITTANNARPIVPRGRTRHRGIDQGGGLTP